MVAGTVTHMDQSLEHDIYKWVIVTISMTHISYSLEYRDIYERVMVMFIVTHMDQSLEYDIHQTVIVHIWTSHGNSIVTHMHQSLEYDVFQTVIKRLPRHISVSHSSIVTYESVGVTNFTTHTWLSHSSSVTHERVRATPIMAHTWTSHSRRVTHDWVTLAVWNIWISESTTYHDTSERVTHETHLNESLWACHTWTSHSSIVTHEWVRGSSIITHISMSHSRRDTWTSHGLWMGAACYGVYESCRTSRCVWKIWIISHIRIDQVWLTCESILKCV